MVYIVQNKVIAQYNSTWTHKILHPFLYSVAKEREENPCDTSLSSPSVNRVELGAVKADYTCRKETISISGFVKRSFMWQIIKLITHFTFLYLHRVKMINSGNVFTCSKCNFKKKLHTAASFFPALLTYRGYVGWGWYDLHIHYMYRKLLIFPEGKRSHTFPLSCLCIKVY